MFVESLEIKLLWHTSTNKSIVTFQQYKTAKKKSVVETMMRRASNPISCEHVFSKKVFKNRYNEKIKA